MMYFYEYKYKSGAKVGGHNLEEIIFKDNYIFLKGIDIISTNYGEDYRYWQQPIDMDEIEYLKIDPMEDIE